MSTSKPSRILELRQKYADLPARIARQCEKAKAMAFSGNYGPNTSLVLEVYSLINHDTLLRPASLPHDSRFTVVTDYQSARRMAFEGLYGPEELTWSDIRCLAVAPAMGIRGDDDHLSPHREYFNKVSDGFFVVISEALPPEFAELDNEVDADIIYSAEARAQLGTGSEFHECLLAIYAAGGWPCGWDGDYPEGRMVGFFPVCDPAS